MPATVTGLGIKGKRIPVALRDYKDEMARVFIDLIKLLYKVELENIFFHRTEQEVVRARKLEAIPILSQLLQKANELLKMSDSKKISISEKLHQALKYMTNNWQELYGYVNIGNVLIDNNASYPKVWIMPARGPSGHSQI